MSTSTGQPAAQPALEPAPQPLPAQAAPSQPPAPPLSGTQSSGAQSSSAQSSAAQSRAAQLLRLARNHFAPTLSPLEEQVLLHSCTYDDPPDYAAPATQPTTHSPTGRPLPGWNGPLLRPGLLRWLLTDPAATALLEPRGLRVWNARIADPLDLAGCRIPVRVEFRYCLFEAPILFTAADLPCLTLRNSTLQQVLLAAGLQLHGPLLFEDILAAGFDLSSASIQGNAQFSSTTLVAEGIALSLADAAITHNLQLAPDFHSAGTLHLRQIRVEGSLLATGATITATPTALDLVDATIHGGLSLDNGFEATGELHLLNTHVDGQMNCIGATLNAPDRSLFMERARVQGNILLSGALCAGTINMTGMEIGGQLNCEAARLTGKANTLILNAATIRGGVLLRQGFSSSGTILMTLTEIGATLECDSAQLTAAPLAMVLEGSKVRGSVFLRAGFLAEGIVQFNYLEIGGQLICDDATITLLDTQGLVVGGDFFWTAIRNPLEARLGLSAATLKSFRDDKASWPAPSHFAVNDLSVKELGLHDTRTAFELANNRRGNEQPLRAADRIDWLNLQMPAALAEPQPWLHLASLLEAKGEKREASRVILELRRHQAGKRWSRHPILRRLAVLFARLEEQPLRVLYPILLLTALSGLTFTAYRAHFAETSESAYHATHSPQPAPVVSSYPKFQPFVYALENVLPVVKLGQDDKWAPDPAHTSNTLYRNLIALRWFLILSGWVLGGILGAAVSARFRS